MVRLEMCGIPNLIMTFAWNDAADAAARVRMISGAPWNHMKMAMEDCLAGEFADAIRAYDGAV